MPILCEKCGAEIEGRRTAHVAILYCRKCKNWSRDWYKAINLIADLEKRIELLEKQMRMHKMEFHDV